MLWVRNCLPLSHRSSVYMFILVRLPGTGRSHKPLVCQGPQEDPMREHRNDHPETAALLHGSNGAAQRAAITQQDDICIDCRWGNPGPEDHRTIGSESWETTSSVCDPPKTPRKNSHRSLELTLCTVGPCPQRKRANGTGGSWKQPNGSWPGSTRRKKKKKLGALQPGCNAPKGKGQGGGVGTLLRKQGDSRQSNKVPGQRQ